MTIYIIRGRWSTGREITEQQGKEKPRKREEKWYMISDYLASEILQTQKGVRKYRRGIRLGPTGHEIRYRYMMRYSGDARGELSEDKRMPNGCTSDE